MLKADKLCNSFVGGASDMQVFVLHAEGRDSDVRSLFGLVKNVISSSES